MAVIFVRKFIYKAYYVSCKQATYYSAKNSNNKFNNKCHFFYHPPFLARVFIRLTEHRCSDVTQPPNRPSSQNETLDAACTYYSTKHPIYCQIKIIMTKTIIG